MQNLGLDLDIPLAIDASERRQRRQADCALIG